MGGRRLGRPQITDRVERVIRLVADGRVQTVVGRVLPLERVDDALAALEADEVVGRVVLQVAT